MVLARATDADVGDVAGLLADAGRALAERGFRNWDPPYPADRVRADVREREVWVVRDGGELVATFTLAPEPPRPYAPPPWPDPSLGALYLNRLAVAPARQGRGVGAWCLAAIDSRAAAVGASAVRCDVLRDNAALRGFYERLGYVACGERSHAGWTFTCYERRVGPDGDLVDPVRR